MALSNRAGQLRHDAALAVFSVLEQGESASSILPAIQKRYDSRDSALLQELFYGVLRELPILQHWLRQLLQNPLKGKKKRIEHIIMVGFYQLAYTRVSQHAAVAETVAAMDILSEKRLKGLVNAILRNFIRQQLGQNPPSDPALRSGFPKWLYKKVIAHYPDHAEDIFAQCRQRPPIWLRVNKSKIDSTGYQSALNEASIAFDLSPTHPDALILRERIDITRLPGFQQGWFSVQDGAAQLAAHLLNAQPAQRVLDCCAAPGGKTCHILENQPQASEVVAVDSDSDRLSRVHENLQRLGLTATAVAGDASQPDSWWDGREFDKILLDAPCSATGIIRKHQDIKWLRKASDIEALTELQAKILNAVWPLLRQGGELLYATCSILPEENSQQIDRFLQHHDDASILPIDINIDSYSPTGLQILPGQQQMDGFYYARLLKS
ncbi:16S rRNA (cytosine(967)-C(5))-methyltransferase RsmB [Aestuariibacter salexigens]|uniref:16S rRNA (cytosine(967)-C(5))-methyltransferase RsmB n=1 Tax=Aestuariibacter salexigens TaxID=226010 RepID=UPI0004274D4F|nr:16S rRNA (cytosine(967)-C(5))-methyltransferase RsmB [Aestuariibacter salexigens]